MVRLDHIGKRYGGGAPVLADVSLVLEPGSFCFLTGASGSGKSVLLRLIHLAELPTQGRLSLFGRDAAALDRAARAAMRRKIGFVFQDCRLFDALSAVDNVALPLRLAGAPDRRARDNAAELLAWVGLAERAAAPTAILSRSERQRVQIARAMIGRPELLIADEPTAAGEEDAVLLVRAFEQLNGLGATALIGTSDIALARRFRHHRVHLEGGMLADAGEVPAA